MPAPGPTIWTVAARARCYPASVFEVAIAVAIIAALLLGALIPPMSLLWLGAALVGVGALVGIPAGLVYHARLYEALRAESLDTAGMWLRPYELHDKLSEERQEPVLLWFLVGAIGFVLTITGAGAVLTALVRLAGT